MPIYLTRDLAPEQVPTLTFLHGSYVAYACPSEGMDTAVGDRWLRDNDAVTRRSFVRSAAGSENVMAPGPVSAISYRERRARVVPFMFELASLPTEPLGQYRLDPAASIRRSLDRAVSDLESQLATARDVGVDAFFDTPKLVDDYFVIDQVRCHATAFPIGEPGEGHLVGSSGDHWEWDTEPEVGVVVFVNIALTVTDQRPQGDCWTEQTWEEHKSIQAAEAPDADAVEKAADNAVGMSLPGQAVSAADFLAGLAEREEQGHELRTVNEPKNLRRGFADFTTCERFTTSSSAISALERRRFESLGH